jgi:hypothetical protein
VLEARMRGQREDITSDVPGKHYSSALLATRRQALLSLNFPMLVNSTLLFVFCSLHFISLTNMN